MFPGERDPLPTGGSGLLRGNRTRSYGSLVHVQSPHSPVRQRRIEHQVQRGETLQGLALKYGVTMEHIKRENRLYTHDSIFLKQSLFIPVLSDHYPDESNGVDQTKDSGQVKEIPKKGSTRNGMPWNKSERTQEKDTAELSPTDFLKNMDFMISQSKQSAVKGCQEGEKRLAALEAACAIKTTDCRLTRSHSASKTSSPRMQHQTILGGVPLTITKCTKKLREQEDEIFEL